MDDEDLNIKEPPLQIGFICEVIMNSIKPKQVKIELVKTNILVYWVS